MKSYLSILALLLTGCATHPPSSANAVRAIPGTVLSTESMESVRYAEGMKAYPIGRYIDPLNPLIMHEGHTLYRVETTAKWNLNPNPLAPLPMGPAFQLIDPSLRLGSRPL